MEDQQPMTGSVLSRVNADPVFTTEAFEAIGVNPHTLSTDLSKVQQASSTIGFFAKFDNGISVMRTILKGVPVQDRMQHLSEYVELKRQELDIRTQLDESKGIDNSRENKALIAELKADLKKVIKDIKFYER